MIEPQKIDLPTETATIDHHLQTREGSWVMYRTSLIQLRFRVYGTVLWIGGRFSLEKFAQVKNRFRSGMHWRREWEIGADSLGSYVANFNWEHSPNSFLAEVINDGLKKGIVLDESFIRHVFAAAMNRIQSYREEFGPSILGKLSLVRTA